MQHNRNPLACLAALLLALCAGSGLEAQQAKSVIDVQAVVNGILAGETTTTSPHLDHNQDGLINVVDAQHIVDQILNPALRFNLVTGTTLTANVPQGVMLIAKHGAGGPYIFTVIGGTLPPGMTVYAVVSTTLPGLPDNYLLQIDGTPTQSGVYNVLIELEDAIGDKFVGTVTITVVP